MTQGNQVRGMIIRFVIIDMVDMKQYAFIWSISSTFLTTIIISLANLMLEIFGKFMVILRTNRIRQAARFCATFDRAKHTLVHIVVNEKLRSFKLLITLFANESNKFLHSTVKITLLRTKILLESFCARSFVCITFPALNTSAFNLIRFKFTVAFTRTESIVESLGMERSTMNHFAAIGAWFIPSGVGTFTRTKLSFSFLNFISFSKEWLAARLANTLDFFGFGLTHTGAGTKLALGGWGGFKWLPANLAMVKQLTTSVRSSERIEWGAGYGIPVCQRLITPLKPIENYT